MTYKEAIINSLQTFKTEPMDYIKREDALNALCDICEDNWICDKSDKAECHKIFMAIPAADVRENVRGRWKEKIIGNPAGGGTLCVSICTLCGIRVYATAVKGDLNFCPNCGADMRGGKT